MMNSENSGPVGILDNKELELYSFYLLKLESVILEIWDKSIIILPWFVVLHFQHLKVDQQWKPASLWKLNKYHYNQWNT